MQTLRDSSHPAPQRERARAMKRPTLSPTMRTALDCVAWNSEPTWWHDVGAGAQTARALHARGLIAEAPGGRAECGTPGCVHPGYMIATAEGFAILENKG